MIGYPNPIRGKVFSKNISTGEDGGCTLQVMWAPEDVSYTELTSIAINTPYKRVMPHFVNLEDKALITCPLPTPKKRKFLRSPIFSAILAPLIIGRPRKVPSIAFQVIIEFYLKQSILLSIVRI